MITSPMMLCAALLLFSLGILWSPVETSSTTVVAASGISIMAEGNRTSSLDGCPTSYGDLTFAYPFGVGTGCSRGPYFSLICDEGTGRQLPRLLFRDGTTKVLQSINVAFGGIQNSIYNNHIRASVWGAIPMKHGVRVHNMSLEPPGRSFSYTFADVLNITRCDLDVYWVDQMTGMTMFGCLTWCPGGASGQEEITELGTTAPAWDAARFWCKTSGKLLSSVSSTGRIATASAAAAPLSNCGI